jgi:hypothetical protein
MAVLDLVFPIEAIGHQRIGFARAVINDAACVPWRAGCPVIQ